jgi:hypothetical protein
MSAAAPAAAFTGLKELFDRGGNGLKEISPRKMALRNRLAPEIVQAAAEIAITDPAMGRCESPTS